MGRKLAEQEELQKQKEQEEEWARQEQLRIKQQEEEEAAKSAALKDQRYDLPPEEAEDDSQGLTAIALYDYQAAADDEISFDPNDIITNIEMVDDGWWLGECHGKFGLFPANYVEIKQ